MSDILSVELQITDETATVKLDRFTKSLHALNADINNAGKTAPFAERLTADFVALEKKSNDVRRAFQSVATTRLDAGNIGNLTKEIIRAHERAGQLARDILQIKSELNNPNRHSSIKFLIDELKAAEHQLDHLNRKLKTVHTPANGSNGQFSQGFTNAFSSRTIGSTFTNALNAEEGISGVAGGAALGGAAGAAAIAAAIAIKQALSAVAGEIKDLSVESVILAGNFEETTNALAIFAGGTSAARRELAEMDKIALDTPGLRLEGAEKGYQRLRALNFEAKLSQDLIRGIGTQRVLSGADNGAVERVITNLTQISSGAGTAADVRQMIQAIPSLRKMFQKEFGTADFGKINELAKSDPDAFLKRFAERLATAETAQVGLNVSIEKGKDSLISLGRTFGEPLLDPLTKDVQSLTKYLNENRDTVADWGQFTADTLRGVSSLISSLSGQEGRAGKLGRVALAIGTAGVSEGVFQSASMLEKFGRNQRFEENLKGGFSKDILAATGEAIKVINAAVKETPSLNKALDAEKAAEQIEKAKKNYEQLLQLTNQIEVANITQNLELEKAIAVRDAKGDALKIARETAALEAAVVREQIRLTKDLAADRLLNLTKDDFNSGKGLLISKQRDSDVAKLENQLLLNRINLQKQVNEEIEKGKNKVKELGKVYSDTFNSLYARQSASNPFAQAIAEGNRELQSLRENLKGLSPELQAFALQMQQDLNNDSLFNVRLDNDFAAFDLRDRANELRGFKNAKIEDPTKFFNDFIEAGLKQLASSNGGTRFNLTGDGKTTQGFSQSNADPYTRYNSNIFTDASGKQFTNGFSQSDARNDLLYNFDRVEGGGFSRRRKSFSDLTTREKSEFINKENLPLQEKLSRQFDLAQNRNILNDEQQATVDRKIIALSFGLRPEQFNNRQRDLIATANEKEASRKAALETDEVADRKKNLEIQAQIRNELQKLNKIAEKEGFSKIEQTLRVITGDGIEAELKPAATSKDTQNAYKGTFFNEYENQ